MGNPCRYFFENKFVIRRPEFDKDKKEVKILAAWTNFMNHKYGYPGMDNKFAEHYDKATIDFYSAPDVIMTYSNGNTCKDEWRRYARWVFTNLRLISIEEPMVEDDWAMGKFAYDELESVHIGWNDPLCETDIPLGKFSGMTLKDVENYKRKNFIKFKDWKPKPSKEAVEAAYKAQTWPPLEHEDVEKMLIAAYAIDL